MILGLTLPLQFPLALLAGRPPLLGLGAFELTGGAFESTAGGAFELAAGGPFE